MIRLYGKGFRELFDSFYTWSLKNPLVIHFKCGPQLLVFIRMRYMATAWLFERQKQDYMHIDSYINPISIDTLYSIVKAQCILFMDGNVFVQAGILLI